MSAQPPYRHSSNGEVTAKGVVVRGIAVVIGVGVLSPLAYILVLTALTVSPVSYVAPLRESGILIGTLMGTRLLDEEGGRRRVFGAAAMAFGIIALALG